MNSDNCLPREDGFAPHPLWEVVLNSNQISKNSGNLLEKRKVAIHHWQEEKRISFEADLSFELQSNAHFI